MSTVLRRLPGVLSFQRGTITTDALFYNVLPDGRTRPVQVVRHGIRGTQNLARFGSDDVAVTRSGRRPAVANVQLTDSARLDPDAVALQVRFDIRFIPIDQLLFACAPGRDDKPEDMAALRAGFRRFVERAQGSEGLREVARRYARNMANGRFLWRNRTVAHAVTVRVLLADEPLAAFDALALPLDRFGDYDPGEVRVGEVVARALCGERTPRLTVVADVDFGVRGAVEVFPSQNYLERKDKGFARPLYHVGDAPADAADDSTGFVELGQAAFREHKVSNALRTIDTWYPGYEQHGRPLPVEPNGASLDAQTFFRDTREASGFRLMLRLGELDPDTPEGMFMLACLIRGGVFSGGEAS
jgi:CRISPR-associated protein Csy3